MVEMTIVFLDDDVNNDDDNADSHVEPDDDGVMSMKSTTTTKRKMTTTKEKKNIKDGNDDAYTDDAIILDIRSCRAVGKKNLTTGHPLKIFDES